MMTKKTIITLVTLILMVAFAVTSSVYTINAHGATEIRPEIYFDGYSYMANSPYQHFMREDIKENNRLLIEIYEMLEDIDSRIAGIEKALGIKSKGPVKSGPTSARPEKKIKKYGTH